MAIFEMVKYHSQSYPEDIPLRTEEIVAHFDITTINGMLARSLHTEYSYGKRKLDSAYLSKFDAIRQAKKDDVPQLWKNEVWAAQFADFIIGLVGSGDAPEVIEVHPPFSDYTDMKGFIVIYSVFEDRILTTYPGVRLLIENRSGSVYHGGRFIISKMKELEDLSNRIIQNNLRLKIAFDAPQIFTAHNATTEKKICALMDEAASIREYIGGAHLWGKRKSPSGRKVAHCGDLNSYFEENQQLKQAFLQHFVNCFNDEVPRKMVLEVNSGNDDLRSIINDLQSVGVRFI